MLVVFFVTLFSVALILTLVGSYLSSRSRTRVQGEVDYVPRRGTSQVDRARIARRSSVTGQWKRSTVPVGYVGTARRRYTSNREGGGTSVVGSWSFRVPYWL